MRTILLGCAAALLAAGAADAGAIVYDPTNAIHNAATAARTLQSLANQAQQLTNEARMLARSPLTQSAQIAGSLTGMDQLSRSVTGLTTDVATVERQFGTLFAPGSPNATRLDLIKQSLARLQAARATAQDLAKVAADLSGRTGSQQARVQASLLASEGATGQTAAVQSSTQLMGVLAEQMTGLQTLMSAQARLASEEAARVAADRQAAADAHTKLWSRDPSAPAAPAFDPLSHASR